MEAANFYTFSNFVPRAPSDLSIAMLFNFYHTDALTVLVLQSDRLNKVLQYVNEVHSLCGVLGLDFGQTVGDVHPSLHGTDAEQSTNISNSTLEGLEHTIKRLKTERKVRIQKVLCIDHS